MTLETPFLLCALVLLAGTVTQAQMPRKLVPATAPMKKSPLRLWNGADPHIAFFNDKFWLYVTSQSALGPKNPVFYVYDSTDLKTWHQSAPALQFKDIPWIYADGQRWHGGWAPAIAEKDGQFFFYYAVGLQGVTPSRLGVARGESAAGPFVDKGEPLFTGGDGFEAIDPMAFCDPQSGKWYLYAGGSAGAKLRMWELAPDMMSLAREIPIETPPGFTEAAFMHYHNGLYYLSYSHGHWKSTNYCVHYATAATPSGPWNYRGTILQSDATRKGPGHHSFLRDPRSGQWFIAYHRWQSSDGGDPFGSSGGRRLAIQPIEYGENGDIIKIEMNDDDLPRVP